MSPFVKPYNSPKSIIYIAIILLSGLLVFGNELKGQIIPLGSRYSNTDTSKKGTDSITVKTMDSVFFSIKGNASDVLTSAASSSQFSTGCPLLDSYKTVHTDSILKRITGKLPSDSTSLEIRKLKKELNLPSTEPAKNPGLSDHRLSYTMQYTSRIEGVYDYSDILQQNFHYSNKITILDGLPVGFQLYGRTSNSDWFRDYIDFRIDLSSRDLSRMTQLKNEKELRKRINIQEKILTSYLGDKLHQVTGLKDQLQHLNTNTCTNQYIHYKELLANADLYKKLYPDSDSLRIATAFIQRYEQLQHYRDSINRIIDSLTIQYRNATGELKHLQAQGKDKLKEGAQTLNRYQNYLQELRIDTTLIPDQGKRIWERFQRLSIGRSPANASQLSFRNITINGINTEYQADKMFYLLQAGWTDFGLRDFLYYNNKQNRSNNFVYNAGIGIGQRNGDHILLSFFGGKKNQLYGQATTDRQTSGLSVSGQLVRRYYSLTAEAAQSSYPKINEQTGKSQRSFQLSDKTNKAYSFTAQGTVPRTNLSAQGYYNYYGINYYGFNAWRVNANSDQWGLQASQKLLRNTLTINAGIKKNDYRNPYVQQVYSGRNTITTLNATWHKNNWQISAGYIPSYQYISINDTLYENRYQVYNLLASYSYKTGYIPTQTSLLANYFTTGNNDTAYFYGNSTNVSLLQNFFFDKYSTGFTANLIQNNHYTYIIFDGNVQSQVNKTISLKAGFRINSLKAANYQSKAGAYGNVAVNIPRIGTLSAQLENNYYPDINYQLYNNTMGVLSFTTLFK